MEMTLIKNNINSGMHWTICILQQRHKDNSLQRLLGLEDVTFLWSENVAEYSTSYCHDPVGTSSVEHICQVTCSSFYPLQKDSSICSIVVLLMAGLAFADKPSFNYLLSNDESGSGPASKTYSPDRSNLVFGLFASSTHSLVCRGNHRHLLSSTCQYSVCK